MDNRPQYPGRLVVMPQFLSAVCDLPKGYGRRIVDAIAAFLRNPNDPNLNQEQLAGKAIGLRGIRVDDSCRIVLSGSQAVLLLYVGSSDQVCRYAGRAGAEATAMAESPIAHQLHSCADPLWVFAPDQAAESPSCGTPISVDDLARLIVRTRKYLPLAHLLLSRGPEIGSMELRFRAIEAALVAALPKAARAGTKWWGNNHSSMHAFAWMAVGWKTSAVDLHTETVTFIRH